MDLFNLKLAYISEIGKNSPKLLKGIQLEKALRCLGINLRGRE